ncbi:methyltransferase family protein [Endozoicomonas arenosclerae]|uniref:methyltransferase family protein n=1 Tax=Endozoicomonas arenosclerae TaxID=1633495 RepID=UPI0007860D3A|nr:isoprenylcysteine carboxylmethyltransferase family protein [Endozoicomonas arenosclerae]
MSQSVSQTRHRLRLSRIAFALTFFILILSQPVLSSYPALQKISFWAGLSLIVIGAMGRFYTMAFIAGMKNKKVVDYGPFSLCRNPLYFFTLCGAAGIGVMTGSLILTALILFMYCVTHIPQIRHEETVLSQRFGEAYRRYKSKTPGFIPNLELYRAPDEISIRPKVLNKAMRDASAWIICIPVISLLNAAKVKEFIPAAFTLL